MQSPDKGTISETKGAHSPLNLQDYASLQSQAIPEKTWVKRVSSLAAAAVPKALAGWYALMLAGKSAMAQACAAGAMAVVIGAVTRRVMPGAEGIAAVSSLVGSGAAVLRLRQEQAGAKLHKN